MLGGLGTVFLACIARRHKQRHLLYRLLAQHVDDRGDVLERLVFSACAVCLPINDLYDGDVRGKDQAREEVRGQGLDF